MLFRFMIVETKQHRKSHAWCVSLGAKNDFFSKLVYHRCIGNGGRVVLHVSPPTSFIQLHRLLHANGDVTGMDNDYNFNKRCVGGHEMTKLIIAALLLIVTGCTVVAPSVAPIRTQYYAYGSPYNYNQHARTPCFNQNWVTPSSCSSGSLTVNIQL